MALKLTSEDDGLAETHEINVTPFIDVMLVLLIIFMVAAPLATADVQVDLPSSTAAPQPRPGRPLFLSLAADGTLSLEDRPVRRDALGPALDAATGQDHRQPVFLRADKGLAYGQVMGVLDLLRSAGYLKVALVGLEADQPGP